MNYDLTQEKKNKYNHVLRGEGAYFHSIKVFS